MEKKSRILIIDDDQVVRLVYRNSLAMAGYDVKVAENGRQGLELVDVFKPDAILLDLILPQMSGLEVLRQIRARSQGATVPVFVLTNSFLSDQARKASQAGANRVFDKAVTRPGQLVEVIKELLGPPGGNTSRAGSAAPAQITVATTYTEPDLLGRQEFVTRLSQAVLALRKLLQGMVKTQDDRLPLLAELCRKVHMLMGEAAVQGFFHISQLCAAMEALLREMHDHPKLINSSTLRTISQAMDVLAVLFTHVQNGQSVPWTQFNVLIVDDDLVARTSITAALQKANLACTRCRDAQEALQTLEYRVFDLIFLDIQMPDVDGFELCAQLRTLPAHKLTPVVFVTSLDDFENRTRSSMVGAADFIGKPFNSSEVAVKALTYAMKARLNKLVGTQPVVPARPSDSDAAPVSDPPPRTAPPQPPVPAPAPAPSASTASPPNPTASADTPSKSSLGSGTDGIVTMDVDWKIQSINPAASRLFGFAPEEIVGKDLAVLIPDALQSHNQRPDKRVPGPNGEDDRNGRATPKALDPDAAETEPAPSNGGTEPRPVIAWRKDGTPFIATFRVREITLADRPALIGIVREFSRGRKASAESPEALIPDTAPSRTPAAEAILQQRRAEAERQAQRALAELAEARAALQRQTARAEQAEERARSLARAQEAALEQAAAEAQRREAELRQAHEQERAELSAALEKARAESAARPTAAEQLHKQTCAELQARLDAVTADLNRALQNLQAEQAQRQAAERDAAQAREELARRPSPESVRALEQQLERETAACAAARQQAAAAAEQVARLETRLRDEQQRHAKTENQCRSLEAANQSLRSQLEARPLMAPPAPPHPAPAPSVPPMPPSAPAPSDMAEPAPITESATPPAAAATPPTPAPTLTPLPDLSARLRNFVEARLHQSRHQEQQANILRAQNQRLREELAAALQQLMTLRQERQNLDTRLRSGLIQLQTAVASLRDELQVRWPGVVPETPTGASAAPDDPAQQLHQLGAEMASLAKVCLEQSDLAAQQWTGRLRQLEARTAQLETETARFQRLQEEHTRALAELAQLRARANDASQQVLKFLEELEQQTAV